MLVLSLAVLNDTWDIQNPTNLALPSCDANICYDVKCIASVGSELWIGAGPSVFFLDEESLERRVCWLMHSGTPQYGHSLN